MFLLRSTSYLGEWIEHVHILRCGTPLHPISGTDQLPKSQALGPKSRLTPQTATRGQLGSSASFSIKAPNQQVTKTQSRFQPFFDVALGIPFH
jgi:hypothetical protein